MFCSAQATSTRRSLGRLLPIPALHQLVRHAMQSRPACSLRRCRRASEGALAARRRCVRGRAAAAAARGMRCRGEFRAGRLGLRRASSAALRRAAPRRWNDRPYTGLLATAKATSGRLRRPTAWCRRLLEGAGAGAADGLWASERSICGAHAVASAPSRSAGQAAVRVPLKPASATAPRAALARSLGLQGQATQRLPWVAL